jgi:hypothetical protein
VQTGWVPKFSPRTDRMAVRVFERAEQTGQAVTMTFCRDVIATLPDADRTADPAQVHALVAIWQRAAADTRRRAMV